MSANTPDRRPPNGTSRRSVLAGGSVAAAALLAPGAAAALVTTPGREVAVFGSGMSGLAAAHELVERGLKVRVYERGTQLGGKARSWSVGSGVGGRTGLPAEHGFRFFPGFYQNVPDSMKRIPRPATGDTAYDSLRGPEEMPGFGMGVSLDADSSFAAYVPFTGAPNPDQLRNSPTYLVSTIMSAVSVLTRKPLAELPPEIADFAAKLAVYLTSCTQRRHGQWDRTGWWEFVGADKRSELYQELIVRGTTQDLVAVKPQDASVLSAGNILATFVLHMLGANAGQPDHYPGLLRFLDGPTSDVWLNPWISYLKSRGVQFYSGQALCGLQVEGAKIDCAYVVDRGGVRRRVDADWFLCGLPIEKVRPMLLKPAILRRDPSLEAIKYLQTDWMNGMQIYLRRPAEQARGVIATLDHPWTISAVTQSLLWQNPIAQKYGDGSVTECISIDISTWDAATQGASGRTTVVGKAARDCTKQEVLTEVWATLKARFGPLDPAFSDDNYVTWTLDPAVRWSNGTTGTVTNDEALSVGTVNTWNKRPKGRTRIPNLFLGGDWIQQVGAGTANMESANLSGKIAAQALIDASGRSVRDITMHETPTPAWLKSWHELDRDRLSRGQANVLEPLSNVTGLLGDLTSTLLSSP